MLTIDNIIHSIIKNKSNNCLICLNNTDYYIKFDCECFNYLHVNCIDCNILTKCYICHKKISYKKNFSEKNYQIDINLLKYIINKMRFQEQINKLFEYLKKNPNIFNIIMYCIISIIITFCFMMPIIMIEILINTVMRIHKYIVVSPV